MTKLLRIERAVSWIARAFTANRDPNPTMEGIVDLVVPSVDVFGSDRLGEVLIETILGPLGGIEIVHLPGVIGSQQNAELTRNYLSVEVFHDDPAARILRMGRIVPTVGGFPFGGFTASDFVAAGITVASRNIVLGPRQLMAAQANAMAAGSRMVMTVVWMQYPPGEYVTGVT